MIEPDRVIFDRKMKTGGQTIGNNTRDIKELKMWRKSRCLKNNYRIMELKSTVAKMRNSLEGFKAAFGHTQESGNFKDRPMEITD